MSETITTLQARAMELVDQHGGVRPASRVLMCDAGYLSRLVRGEKTEPGDALLKRMGLRRKVSYVVAAPPQPVSAEPATVEQAISLLKIALRDSKGWMLDYSDAIIRDAIDRKDVSADAGKGVAPTGYEKMRGGKPVTFWRDDALEAAAIIVEDYQADEQIAADIRAMKSKPSESVAVSGEVSESLVRMEIVLDSDQSANAQCIRNEMEIIRRAILALAGSGGK